MSYILALTLFFASNAFSQSFISLELLSSEYLLSEKKIKPSCTLFKHRRLEREKVLRELKHHLELTNWNTTGFFKDDYILNKFFLDKELWQDETVTIVNTWKVPESFSNEFNTSMHFPFLFLSGDGIEWRSPMNLFPEEVSFSWSEADNTLVSQHTTYFIDYCSPQKKNQLLWFPLNSDKPQMTQIKINEILNQLKEI